jgi:hypothetical protein
MFIKKNLSMGGQGSVMGENVRFKGLVLEKSKFSKHYHGQANESYN